MVVAARSLGARAGKYCTKLQCCCMQAWNLTGDDWAKKPGQLAARANYGACYCHVMSSRASSLGVLGRLCGWAHHLQSRPTCVPQCTPGSCRCQAQMQQPRVLATSDSAMCVYAMPQGTSPGSARCMATAMGAPRQMCGTMPTGRTCCTRGISHGVSDTVWHRLGSVGFMLFAPGLMMNAYFGGCIVPQAQPRCGTEVHSGVAML